MNKSELVAAIAEKSNTTVAAASRALAAFIETVEGELQAGNRVELIGFGSFEVRVTKARNGRNPSNGETIQIPSKKVAKFKTSPKLNQKL